MWDLHKKGLLIALYQNGTQRTVGINDLGGFDQKSLDDRENGLCDIGTMAKEPCIQVPESLLQEMIEALDVKFPMSKELETFIQQQEELEQILSNNVNLSR